MTTVWAVCGWMNCDDDHEGVEVLALYMSEQTARQHLDRKGGHSYGYVQKMEVRSSLHPC